MFKTLSRFALLFSMFFASSTTVAAQANGPIYIVQPGDSLSSIAARFNVTVEAIMEANSLTDPNLLAAGKELIIPGLEGVSGILDTEVVQFGDSYRSLLRRTQVPRNLFNRLNHLISPSEFYIGSSMIIPVEEAETKPVSRFTPKESETLLETAVKNHSDVWSVVNFNQLAGSWAALPGDVIYMQGGDGDQGSIGLPAAFVEAGVRDLPIKQGGTGVIIVRTEPGVVLGGYLVDHALHFNAREDGTQVALQGVHALLEPGVYPLRLVASLPDGSSQSFEQMVLIVSGYYDDISISVPSETLNPSITEPENQELISLTSAVSPVKRWQGAFKLPVDPQDCIKDWFGIRRTYIGQGTDIKLNGFHSGLDYGVCSETHPYDIYAPAPGIVVFSGPLTVRGNATIIDHGWGVFSGYWHQAESYVTAGQEVETGDLIGKIGATGRVTGPHLHWEIWVNGVQVDPLDWLEKVYP